MNNERDIVVGIGEALWDMLPEGKKIGGAPANFAYHMSQFGIRSIVVSAIGDDELGNELITDFQNKKLDFLIERVAYPTGTVDVVLDSNGVPCYDIRQNVAWDNIPLTDRLLGLAKHTCAVCFGSLAQRNPVSRSTINSFINAIPDDESVYKIFDINLRQNFFTNEIVCESMQRCNILKINDEELTVVSRTFGYPQTDIQVNCHKLLERFNLKMLILTCGVDGSFVFTPNVLSFVPTPKVDVADTVGAGDSFTAAFVAALIKGKSVTEAHKSAADVSAFVCTRYGAMPQLPTSLTAI